MNDKSSQQVRSLQELKGGAEDLSPEANVHKIREIIFGGQMREYDRRFDELSARLENETRRIKQDLEQRLDKFESYIQKEFEQLNLKQQKERTERTEAQDKLQQSLAMTDRGLNDKLVRLDEQFTKETTEIRKHILTQVNDLVNRITQLNEQLNGTLKSETQRLQDLKVSRGDLSELLTEVALRLSNKHEPSASPSKV